MGILGKIRGSKILKATGKIIGSLSILPTLMVSKAYAQDLSPITNMIEIIRAAIIGPIGIGISAVAIAVVGILFFSGRAPWQALAATFAGVVLVLSANVILGGFAGSS